MSHPRSTTERMKQIAVDWTREQLSVHAYLRASVGDPHVAEELLQRTAAAVVEKADRYDPARPFVGWAIGIARTEVRRHREQARLEGRKLRSLSQVDDVLAEATTRVRVEKADIRAALESCLGELTDRAREVVSLYHGRSTPPEEIAVRFGTSRSNVLQILHRTRLALRACVERRLGSWGVE